VVSVEDKGMEMAEFYIIKQTTKLITKKNYQL
jgi:hypothetical protein